MIAIGVQCGRVTRFKAEQRQAHELISSKNHVRDIDHELVAGADIERGYRFVERFEFDDLA